MSRKRNIKFHIKHQDYFGTFATVLSLILQNNQKYLNDFTALIKRSNNQAKRLVKDLVWLQENYEIKNEISAPSKAYYF